mgnify:CR=1 FL=1
MEIILTMPEPSEHIMVVEDDPSLAEWICDYLTDRGYLVTVANSGDIAVELIESDMPDLVLLDIMLPNKSGFDVCKEVRAFYPNPILMMTACTEEADEILGLELGADDYIAKPVKPRVLLARIKALLCRGPRTITSDKRSYGKLQIDATSKTIVLNNQIVNISVNEFEVFWLLASQPGKVVNRHDMISQLRGFDYDGFDRSIDLRISRLRKKLQDDTNQPYRIKTVRGKGYLFAPDAWA